MEITNLDESSLLSLMERLPARELLALSQTCTTYNNLLSENDVLLNKFRFKIVLSKFDNNYAYILSSLMELVVNKQFRDYKNLQVSLKGDFSEIERIAWINLLKGFKNVTNLKFEMNCYNCINAEDWQLLEGFTQVNELDVALFKPIPPNIRAPMTNLKKLKCGNRFMPYFLNCTALTDLKLHISFTVKENFSQDTEDWLLKQKNLKHLELDSHCDNHFKFFETDRTAEVPFQLESLSVTSNVHGAQVPKFIARQQRSLIECKYNGHGNDNSVAQNKVLKAILMLPRLKTLTIKNVKSVAELTDIRNTSIRLLNLDKFSLKTPMKDLAIICVNADVIKCSGDHYFRFHKHLPSDVLHKLRLPKAFRLLYDPETIPEDQHAFEEDFLFFIRRNTAVKYLIIGHERWLQHEGFGLSLRFFKDLLRFLPNLIKLELFSNAGAHQIINHISTNESQLKSINLHYSMGNYVFTSENTRN